MFQTTNQIRRGPHVFFGGPSCSTYTSHCMTRAIPGSWLQPEDALVNETKVHGPKDPKELQKQYKTHTNNTQNMYVDMRDICKNP